MKKPKPDEHRPAPAESSPDSAKPAAAKRSAVKLPEGVTPRTSSGPRQGPGWDRNASARPQRDAARRAGKSRKVH